jgi:hypothetical protein
MTLPDPDVSIASERMIERGDSREFREQRARILGQRGEENIVDRREEKLRVDISEGHSLYPR